MAQDNQSKNRTYYQLKISRESAGDFLQDAREAIFQSQVEGDAKALLSDGRDLTLTQEGTGKASLVVTAEDPSNLDELRTIAEARGYELPDHEEITISTVEVRGKGSKVLMHSPTEYLFGATYRPPRPDHPVNDHVGQAYDLVGYDLDLEREPALTFRIRFADGHEVHVYPEEIDNTYHSVVAETPPSGVSKENPR